MMTIKDKKYYIKDMISKIDTGESLSIINAISISLPCDLYRTEIHNDLDDYLEYACNFNFGLIIFDSARTTTEQSMKCLLESIHINYEKSDSMYNKILNKNYENIKI